MATSGWQNEQTWYTYSSNIHLNGNIRIDGITHSGSNLRVWGAISAGARGNANYRFYFSDYTSYAQPEGGGKIALGGKGKTWRVGDGDEVVGFDVTLSGVSAGTTSRSFFVNFYGPNTNSVQSTLRWTLYFDPSGSQPSGLSVVYNSSTWNSVSATVNLQHWGGVSGKRLEAFIVTGSSFSDFSTITPNNWSSKGLYRWQINTTAYTADFSGMMQTNAESTSASPRQLRGLVHYYLGMGAVNSVDLWKTDIDMTPHYLPPAKPVATVTDPGGEGTKNYSVVVTGDVTNNTLSYDADSLTRTVRYKVNDAAEWTYAAQDQVALLGDNTEFTVRVPGSQGAVIESWMTYHGLQSEVKTTNIYNGNAPSRVYGSVDGESKLLYKLYGSVDGQSVEIVKLYGSVDGKAKAILG